MPAADNIEPRPLAEETREALDNALIDALRGMDTRGLDDFGDVEKGTRSEGGDKPDRTPPVLFDATQPVLAELSAALGCPVLTYWNSRSGHIADHDVVAVYEALRRIGRVERAALVIKSDGGSGEAALRVAHLIREHVRHLIVLAPQQCASAATLLALAADQIAMGPLAHLTAIDSSLRHELSPIDEIGNDRVFVSQDELLRIVALWNENGREHHANPYTDIFKYIHPLVVGAIDRSSSLSVKICEEALSYQISDPVARARISKSLNSDYPSHSYPITRREAARLGLNVVAIPDAINDTLLRLGALYSEMGHRAVTFHGERRVRDRSIWTIIECAGAQLRFQNDFERRYIQEERRWRLLDDDSLWRIVEADGLGGSSEAPLYID